MAPTVLAHPGQHLGADGLPALDLAVTARWRLWPRVSEFPRLDIRSRGRSPLVADDLEGAVSAMSTRSAIPLNGRPGRRGGRCWRRAAFSRHRCHPLAGFTRVGNSRQSGVSGKSGPRWRPLTALMLTQKKDEYVCKSLINPLLVVQATV